VPTHTELDTLSLHDALPISFVDGGGDPLPAVRPRLEQVFEIDLAGGVAELGQTPGFDLTDPLPGGVDHFPDIRQGPGLVTIEPEPQPDHLSLLRVEMVQSLDEPVPAPGRGGHRLRIEIGRAHV